MKSLTGKFTSVGGWAPLLALLLGAGLMISACGDEEVPAPTTPAPAPTPTPTPAPEPEPEPEPTGPATPEGLRVTSTGSNFLEWGWNAVEGALGYNVQFGANPLAFTDTDPAPQAATGTSYRLANLPGNTTLHLRVRTVAGTLQEQTLSDWSAPFMGTTSAPPPATPLSAPGDLGASNPSETTVNLSWDEVDDADSYEVQQRVDGAGSWSDATCGEGGSGSTENTSCVATGLTPETDYEFRVRAVPASDDDAHTASSWSETEATTADDTGPAVVMGSGDLSLIWSSESATMIDFTWDQISGAEYEVAEATSATGCETATYQAPDSGAMATWHPLTTVTPGEAGSLCVRTKDKEHMSFAKGVALPSGKPTLAANAITEAGAEVADRATTAITWSIDTVEFKAGFDFDMRVAADPERDNKIKGADAMNMNVQDACLAGTQLESGDTDVNVTFDRISLDRGLRPYTGYLLCLRMMNDSGATDWVVPVENKEALTLPARPPAPRLVPSLTRVNPANAAPVWSVATRGATNIPRLKTGYEAKSIVYPATWDHDNMEATARRLTPRPTVAVCESDATGEHLQWMVAPETDIVDSPDGIVIGIGTVDRLAVTTAPKPLNPSKIVLLCVRATVDTDREGPWVMSSSYSVPPVPRP